MQGRNRGADTEKRHVGVVVGWGEGKGEISGRAGLTIHATTCRTDREGKCETV